MPIYKVTHVYTYTTSTKVQANSAKEAKEIALTLEGSHNNDDSLYDSIASYYSEVEDAERT